MKIFTCRHQFEDMMTCIYTAWEYALTVGHDKVRLMLEPVYQETLFDEYIHVEADALKTEKVIRSIKKQMGNSVYVNVYYASLSAEDVLDDIYRFLRVGFRMGPGVMSALTEPTVVRMLEIRRKIGNEIHHFREFARFHSVDSKVYVCHLEPENDIIYQVAEHFADRMPSEYFMIIDDNRKYAVVHPGAEESSGMYIRELDEREMQVLHQTELQTDAFVRLWKTFFHTIGIEQRKNLTCQRNMIPIWKRKHAVEFMD